MFLGSWRWTQTKPGLSEYLAVNQQIKSVTRPSNQGTNPSAKTVRFHQFTTVENLINP
jgi:hypothetical protein